MLSREQQYTIKGHKNEFGHRRSFTMFAQSPEEGINDQTGVLLVLQNLTSVANNQYWHRLRNRWANLYNVVAVGLNYQGAGWTGRGVSRDYTIPIDTANELINMLPEEDRQSSLIDDPEKLLCAFAGQDLSQKGIILGELHNLEFWKNYPDYGFNQAMDCLWALGSLWQICRDNDLPINRKRTYLYGVNEGGHIAQMCGRFAPNTFTLIVDNSGYPFISIDSMLGRIKADYEKKRLPAGDSFVDVLVSLPKTYGLTDNSRYYITEDMLEIRDLRRYLINSSSKYLIIQTEGDNPEKRNLFERMRDSGIDVEYIVEENHINDENVYTLFDQHAGRYISPDSKEMLVVEGSSDFELGTKITFETTNGQYIVSYASGAPVIDFEGEIIVLRLEDDKDNKNDVGNFDSEYSLA